jgi:hypothetical protein
MAFLKRIVLFPPRSNNDNEQVEKVIIWSTYIFASKGSKYKQPKQTYSK